MNLLTTSISPSEYEVQIVGEYKGRGCDLLEALHDLLAQVQVTVVVLKERIAEREAE